MASLAIEHGGDLFAIAHRQGWDWREVLDFSASINPLGPSPRVAPAICAALGRIAHYPERGSPRLCRALAETWNLREEQILVGNGATELIFFVARLFRSATLAQPVFSEFDRAFPGAADCDLTKPDTWPHEGLLVLTRPANPTGWTLPLSALVEYLLRSSATVLVDESFLEFSRQPSAATLLNQFPNLLVLRSLTKFYALPGLRVGALIGNVTAWKEKREPWQVNVLAEEAALAALSDIGHAARSVEFVSEERRYLAEQLGTAPSDANFLYVALPHRAASLKAHLLLSKILIRTFDHLPGVRIAVRTRAENNRLLEAWRDFRPWC